MAKKRTKRDRIEYPVLAKKYNSRVKQELIDYDYISKLSDEERQWLEKFSDEYINATFKHDETDLHQTKELHKERYDANNARNRCLYGRIKNKVGATKLINYDLVKNVVEEELGKDMTADNVEDAVIELVDYILKNSDDSAD